MQDDSSNDAVSVKLSANLGYLWTDLDLLEAIRAAADAGFDAVEVHWPYVTHSLDVALALVETEIPLLSLNTVGGALPKGEFGLAALPGRQSESRAAIDKALAYAADVSAHFVHVLAGNADGKAAAKAYEESLRYATDRGAEFDVDILIEPLNPYDMPGYFLQSLSQAADTIERLGRSNLHLLFDCYHTGRTEGDVIAQFERYVDIVGHVQIASVPDRREPDHGEVDFAAVLAAMVELGFRGFVGAEYRPAGRTEDGLDWLALVDRRFG